MIKKIGFVGGDLRIIQLAKMYLQENYLIYTYGLENSSLSKYECEDLNTINKECNIIVSGIPFSKDNILINTPLSGKKIYVKEFFEKIKNKNIFAGVINEDIIKKTQENNIYIYDLMKDEYLTILNAIPTVEGALQIAMQETEITINSSNCLVLGFGRIGKVLCKTLYSLGADVTCSARKEEDFAWIKAYNYKFINTNNILKNIQNYQIIFNTIPAQIIGEKELKLINKNTVIIDLASNLGGVDF